MDITKSLQEQERIPYFHMDICFLWIIGNNANTFQIEYAITETIPLMV